MTLAPGRMLHGVSLSIGSADPLNHTYLTALRQMARRFAPAWIPDHLCWTEVGGHNLHDLLPLPYTDAVVRWLHEGLRRIRQNQKC